MRAALKLEYFGWDQKSPLYSPPKPWVARLTGYSELTNKFKHEFVSGQIDFSESNSKGSRSVFLFFWLESGWVYLVRERVSWRRSVDWYAAISEDGDVVKIKREDAVLCLS